MVRQNNKHTTNLLLTILFVIATFISSSNADPFPPNNTNNASGMHYAPVAWPAEAEWKPYGRFGESVIDPAKDDPSHGGTTPQNYVSITSSCDDATAPSIYYYLRTGATPADDVIMFRWRVGQIANTYATGPSAGTYGTTDPWGSALWTVFFDLDGDGYRDIAAHLDGSSGSPGEDIDRIVGIYSDNPTQSLDYNDNPNIHLLGHNPTAFVDTTGTNKIYNYHSTLSPDTNWPNGADENVWDYGTTRSTVSASSPCNEYYIDYQIPVAMIDASAEGGPALDRTIPLSMLFCTSNSLNNPMQKDCALDNTWTGDPNKPAPFGDYLSFDKENPYVQPIVDDITAAGCSPTTILTAKIKDSIAIVDGETVSSLKEVQFWVYRDVDGNGKDDDEAYGSKWEFAENAISTSLNTWVAEWNSKELFAGQYLIGVVAIDDPTKVDVNMDKNGITNITFSFLSEAEVNDTAKIPEHFKNNYPDDNVTYDWHANPEITGVKDVGLSSNTCGTIPGVKKFASIDNIVAGDDVNYTIVLTNKTGYDINATRIIDNLPKGFTYNRTISLEYNHSGAVTDVTNDTTYSAPDVNSTGTIVWDFNVTTETNSTVTLVFEATASDKSGSYNNHSLVDTSSFGLVTSNLALVQVDAARISLSKIPSSYFVDPGESLIYTLKYSNDSNVELTNVELNDILPPNVTCNSYSLNGGSDVDCTGNEPTIAIDIGTVLGLEGGTVEMNVTVDASYSSASLLNNATLNVTAPDGSDVNKSAESTIAVDVPVAAFTLEKESDTDFVELNGNIVYTITYKNYGDAPATDVVITDRRPIGFVFVETNTTVGYTDNGDRSHSWSLGTVEVNGTASITITLKAEEDPVVTDTFTGPNPSTNEIDLTWSDPDNGGVVYANDTVGVDSDTCIAFYATNIREDVGYDGIQNITQTEIVNPEMTMDFNYTNSKGGIQDVGSFYMDTDLSQDVNSSDLTKFNMLIDYTPSENSTVKFYLDIYDYNPLDGNTRLIEGNVSKSTSGNAQKTIMLQPSEAFYIAAGHRIKWDVRIESSVDQIIYLHINSLNSRALQCRVAPAVMSVSKTVDTTHIETADLPKGINYTIEVANISGTTVTGIDVNETFPDNVTCNSYSIDGGAATSCPSPFSVALSDIDSGLSRTININATVESAASGTLTNFVVASSDNAKDVNDTAETTVGSLVPPQLIISKDVNATYMSASDTVRYTLTVVNIGGKANDITVSDTIPQEAYFSYLTGSIDGNSSGSGVVIGDDTNSPNLNWTISSLGQGETATLIYDMKTSATGIPAGIVTRDNVATVSDPTYCTDANVSGCTSNVVTVSISGNPELEIVKTVSNPTPKPGEVIVYTIVLKNIGSTTATSVIIRDPLTSPQDPVVSDNLIYNSQTMELNTTAGTAIFNAAENHLEFELGDIAAGDTVTMQVELQVREPLPSGINIITNRASAAASNARMVKSAVDITVKADVNLTVDISGPSFEPYPNAKIKSGSTGTTLSLYDTSLLTVGDLIKVDGEVVTITSVTGDSIEVDRSITVSTNSDIAVGVTYNVIYKNVGNADANDTQLTVDLGGLDYYSSTGNGVESGGTVTWDLSSTVVSGKQGSFQIIAFPPAYGSYTLDALIQSQDVRDNAEPDNRDSVTTIFGGLVIKKSTSTPLLQSPNIGTADANYTITISNTLPDSIADVNVSDILPSGFSYKSETNTGGCTADGDANYPSWTGCTVPASGNITIEFIATIDANTSATTHQNAVVVSTSEANISISQYDELSSNAEDVTVFDNGMIEGYIFEDKNDNGVYDDGIDVPFTNIEINISKDSNASFFYTLYTDADGYFYRDVENDNWTVDYNSSVPDGQGLSLGTGTNPTKYQVLPRQKVTDINAYISGLDLNITKTASNLTPYMGTDVNFTIRVTNAGPGAATDVNATDKLPTGFIYRSHSASVVSDYNDTTGVWEIGDMSFNATVELNITAEVNATGVYLNESNVTSADTDTNLTNNEANVTLTPKSMANLNISKDVNVSNPYVGTDVNFTIMVINNGPSNATDVNVTDALPNGYIYRDSNVSQGTDYNITTGIWRVGTLAVDDNATLIIQAIVTATDDYTNEANVTSIEHDANLLDNNASVTPTPIPVADLNISKDVNDTTPIVGTDVNFTITVINNGPSTAMDINVTDVLPNGYIYRDSNVTQGADYNATTGIWEAGNLAVNTNATLWITAEVNTSGLYRNDVNVTSITYDSNLTDNNNSETTTPVNIIDAVDDNFTTPINGLTGGNAGAVDGNDTLNGVLINLGTDVNIITVGTDSPFLDINTITGQAFVPANTPSGTYTESYTICEIAYPNNCDEANVTVVVVTSDLNITKEMIGSVDVDGSGTLSVGDTFNYTVTMENSGTTTLYNVDVNDSKITPNTIHCNEVNVSETCVLTGEYNLTQADIDTGFVFNKAIADSNTTPPVETSLTTPIAPNPDLNITKTQDGGAVAVTVPGDINYTITVENNGTVSLTDINITDIMPNGDVVTLTSPSGDDDNDSVLDVNETWVYTAIYAVTQDDIDAGVPLVNLAVVDTNQTDDRNDTAITPVMQNHSFTVEKSTTSIPTIAGDTLIYIFDVNNTGNVTLTDINLSDVKCDGLIALIGGDDGDGDLDVGEIHRYSCTSIAVTQGEINAGEVFNEVNVTVVSPSGTIIVEEDNLTTLVHTGNITLEKIGVFVNVIGDKFVDVGDEVHYEFNITNTGNITLYDINITDGNAVLTGGPIASLMPGESNNTAFTGVHIITWQDILDGVVINQAIVTSKDLQGNDINDTSDDPTTTPDDNTSTGLPIKMPESTNDEISATWGEHITIEIVDNDQGGTFDLNASSVTLIEPVGAINVIVDADGDIVGFDISGEGRWSVDEDTGDVTFSPEEGYIGDPTPIEYTIEDTQGNPTTSEIIINYPPVAMDDLNNTASAGEAVLIEVLLNDRNTSLPLDPKRVSLIAPVDAEYVITDIDGDIIGFIVPDEGEWIVDEDTGIVTFMPIIDFVGDPTPINYTVRETNGDLSNEATINVIYDLLPVAEDNYLVVTHYGGNNGTVVDNDMLGAGTAAEHTWTLTRPPEHGTVEFNADGTYTYYPDANYDGSDSFEYIIMDANGNTDTGEVIIDVDCTSTQTSDNGDTLNLIGFMMMIFIAGIIGLYFIRRENERKKA